MRSSPKSILARNRESFLRMTFPPYLVTIGVACAIVYFALASYSGTPPSAAGRDIVLAIIAAIAATVISKLE